MQYIGILKLHFAGFCEQKKKKDQDESEKILNPLNTLPHV